MGVGQAIEAPVPKRGGYAFHARRGTDSPPIWGMASTGWTCGRIFCHPSASGGRDPSSVMLGCLPAKLLKNGDAAAPVNVSVWRLAIADREAVDEHSPRPAVPGPLATPRSGMRSIRRVPAGGAGEKDALTCNARCTCPQMKRQALAKHFNGAERPARAKHRSRNRSSRKRPRPNRAPWGVQGSSP